MTQNSVFIVTGLGFGDEGKGTTVDYLVRKHGVKTVIRHNGGAQAGHNVVTEGGVHHTFAQFCSGTFGGAKTYLSRHMVVHPGALLVEAKHLERKGVKDPLSLVSIDERALVITPFHQSYNRVLELSRGVNRHGTCGVGVGATVSDSYLHPIESVRIGDLWDIHNLRKKLKWLQARKISEAEEAIGNVQGSVPNEALEELSVLKYLDIDQYVWDLKVFCRKVLITNPTHLQKVLDEPTVVFEGAQGVLLDEWHGFHPHTTYSTCTHDNALGLLSGYQGKVVRLGVLRTYLTRHGQGPFPTVTPNWSRSEPHNSPKGWQGQFRWGAFDSVLARYAIRACDGIDGLVLTHMDVPTWTCCDGHLQELPVNRNKIENGYQEHLLPLVMGATPNVPEAVVFNPTEVMDTLRDTVGEVVLGSYGPTSGDKVEYRDLV